MKVEYIHRRVDFDVLEPGEVFIKDGSPFMVVDGCNTDNDFYVNCVNLRSGELSYCSDIDTVEKCENPNLQLQVF